MPPIPANEISRGLHLKGWSDSDLAQRTGIDRARINRIKNRRVVPRTSEALAIARALDLPVAQLFPGWS